MASQLTDRDKELLDGNNVVRVGDYPYEDGYWGTKSGRDFVHFQIFDVNGNLIQYENLPLSQFSVNNKNILLYPGNHIRNLGFESGVFNVKYNFLRKLAGHESAVLVHTLDKSTTKIGDVYTNTNNIYITEEGIIYSGTEEEFRASPTIAEQLRIEDLKYQIDEISPSRTEVRLKAKQINSSYISDFVNIQTSIKTEETDVDISFDGDVFESKKLTISPPNGGFVFTPKMVQGTLTIPNVYKVNEVQVAVKTGINIIKNPNGEELITDNLGNVLSIANDREWDASLHDDAVRVKEWSDGFNSHSGGSNAGTAAIGYHAKWVQNEGVNAGTCMKFPDTNDLFVDLDAWQGSAQRWLGISQRMQNLQGVGAKHFDIVNITADIKSTVVGKGVRYNLYYPYALLEEPKPTSPPAGFFNPANDGPTETQPTDPPPGFVQSNEAAAAQLDVKPPESVIEMLNEYPEMITTGFKTKYQTTSANATGQGGANAASQATAQGSTQTNYRVPEVGDTNRDTTLPYNETINSAWRIREIIKDAADSSAAFTYVWEPNLEQNLQIGFQSSGGEWEWNGNSWVVVPSLINSPTPPAGVVKNIKAVNHHPYVVVAEGSFGGDSYYSRKTARGLSTGWQTGTIAGGADDSIKIVYLFKDDLVWKSVIYDDNTENLRLETLETWFRNNLLRTIDVLGQDGVTRKLYDDIFENGFIQSVTRARDTGNDNKCLSSTGYVFFYNDGRGDSETSNKVFTMQREEGGSLINGTREVSTVSLLSELSPLLNTEVNAGENKLEVSFHRDGDDFDYFFLTNGKVHKMTDGDGELIDEDAGLNDDGDFPQNINEYFKFLPNNNVPDVFLPNDPTTQSDDISRHITIYDDQVYRHGSKRDELEWNKPISAVFYQAGVTERDDKELTYGSRNPGATNFGIHNEDGEVIEVKEPIYDNGNSIFDFDPFPSREGTLSELGVWVWSGNVLEGWVNNSLTPPRYQYKPLYNENESMAFPSNAGEWQSITTEVLIPSDWILSQSWTFIVYGHQAGSDTGRFSQGVVWVDNLYMDFTLVDQSVTEEVFKPFSAKIESQQGTSITINKNIREYSGQIGAIDADEDNNPDIFNMTDTLSAFKNFKVSYTNLNPKDLRTYLKFGNDLFLTTNFKQDKINVSNYPHAVVYKLYEPLPDAYVNFDECIIVKEMANPLEETIKIVDFVPDEEPRLVLKSPDLSNVESPVKRRQTQYKSETDILTSDTTISTELKNEFLSQSLDSVEINTDYSQYKNFVNFSSVEKRIRNFKSKLENIESFKLSSGSFIGVSGSVADVKFYENSINETKNNFDSFEKYMYFESSSYVSSSLGVFYDNAWPKTSGDGNLNSPYVLAHTTSSVANTWFSNAMTSASIYDLENDSKLSNVIPEHIKFDTNNETYLRFTDMIGQHFDGIWEYINALSDTYDRRDKLDEGMSKDLLYSVGRSLGWTLDDGKDLINLPRYALGKEVTGSSYSDRSATSERDISREIWSRIINNMPFFLKNKGTVRALKGLINVYGIPSTILRVKEFGGPKLSDDESPQFEITRKFTKALDFRGEQSVKVAWADDVVSGRKPDSVEFRFRAATGSNQILVEKQDNNNQDWFIRLKDNGSVDNYGQVSFMLSGSAVGVDVGQYKELLSSELPVYDGDFYSVMVNRTSGSSNINVSQSYELNVGKYDASRSKIHLYSTSTMDVTQAASSSFSNAWTGSGDIYIGGSGSLADVGAQFSGSIMEYRHWTEVLNTGSFKNHIANPKAYDGNTVSSSYENLVLRYSFNDNKDLNADVEGIRDVSSNQTTTLSGSHSGFTGNFFRSVEDQLKTHIPSIGALRRTTNKIRIENNPIKKDAQLSSKHRATDSAYDTAPNDSNKVGIWFAPTDVVNTDIINSVGDLNFEDYLGDPRDKKETSYRGLNYVADNYWKKYTAPNNLWDYIRLIKYYDQSLYPQLRKLIPARAKPDIGLLIEPNIFERPKVVVGKTIDLENTYYTASINVSKAVNSLIVITGSYNAGLPITNYDAYTGRIAMSSFETGSSAMSASGEYLTFEASGSEIRDRSYELSVWQRLSQPGEYSNVTMSFGETIDSAKEVIVPVISGSRIYRKNQKTMNFYTSSADALILNANSSSLFDIDLDNSSMIGQGLFNSFYGGVKNTRKTTTDGNPPVEVIISAPTKLVTTEEGESPLRTGDGIVSGFKEPVENVDKPKVRTIRGLKKKKKKIETERDRKKIKVEEKFERDKRDGKLDGRTKSAGYKKVSTAKNKSK